jgi:Na+/melibiose symporter-like transporter
LLLVEDRPNHSEGVPLRPRQLLANPSLRRLLLAYVLNNTGNAVPAALFLLYVEHVLQRPDQSAWLISVFFLAGLLGFAVWIPISRRVGKHRAWSLSMLFACVVFALVPFLQAGDTGLFLLICLFTGLSLGVDMALPASIQADVLDLDRTDSGGERAGLLFGIWGMATKLALALGVGLAFPLIALAGFDPAVPNDAQALTALAWVYAGLPVLLKLASAGLIWHFPFTERSEETDAHDTNRQPASGAYHPDRLRQHEAG